MGNPHSHAILRGFVDKNGKSHPNYHYDDVMALSELYEASGLENPACIIDTSHANSGKNHLLQPVIAEEIMKTRAANKSAASLIKGLMIESYLVDGCQPISTNEVYGKSITDPCLGWEKTERLIYDIAEKA